MDDLRKKMSTLFDKVAKGFFVKCVPLNTIQKDGALKTCIRSQLLPQSQNKTKKGKF